MTQVCEKCGGNEFRVHRYTEKRGQSPHTVERDVCMGCKRKADVDSYQRRKEKHLAAKRALYQARGGRPLEVVRANASIKSKRRRQKLPKGVRRGNGRKAIIQTGAYRFSLGRLAREYAKRCDLRVETARWRIRYEYDADFKAKTIERVHRKNTARKAHIAMVDDGTLTGLAIRNLFASAKRCCYCERPMRSKDKTLDHVTPLSRGGMHSIHNAAIACHSCNTGKGGRTPEEWRSGVVSRRRAA